LRVQDNISDELVAFTAHNSSYIDSQFFINKMKEQTKTSNKTGHNYIVDISCFEIDWIMNRIEGRRFLNQILIEQQEDIFENQIIQNIIEYFYQKYYRRIMLVRFPLYMVQVFVIHATIALNPRFHHGVIEYDPLSWDIIVTFLNVTCVIFSVVVLLLQWYYGSNITFLTNKWNYFEIGYITWSFILASLKT
jgi:hypothetical protein